MATEIHFLETIRAKGLKLYQPGAIAPGLGKAQTILLIGARKEMNPIKAQ